LAIRNLKSKYKIQTIKKQFKILFRVILAIVILLLLIAIAMLIPWIQTQLAQYAMKQVNQKYNTSIAIDKARISVFGGIKFKDVLILDHHKDTLIYVETINSSLTEFKKLTDGDLLFDAIDLNNVLFQLKTYKNEPQNNFNIFVDKLDSGAKSTKPFLMTAAKASISNAHFICVDENKTNTVVVDFTNIDTKLKDFKIIGPEVAILIQKLAFKDYRGTYVTDMSTDFTYNRSKMSINHLKIKTPFSKLEGKVVMNYKIEDFQDFNNKVQFEGYFNNTTINAKDVAYYYDGLSENVNFDLKTNFKGKLNQLYFNKLSINDSNNNDFIGTIHFENILGNDSQFFKMNADFTKINTNYNSLIATHPKTLEAKLPVNFKYLEQIDMKGKLILTANDLVVKMDMNSNLGYVKTDFELQNMYHDVKASYKGELQLDRFELGKLIQEKSIGTATTTINFDGQGYNYKTLKTKIIAKADELQYNNYKYNHLSLNGLFDKSIFEGHFDLNDANLKLNFDGKVNYASKQKDFDFKVQVQNANLNKLQFNNQTISNFKGNANIKLKGSTIDDLTGIVNIESVVYQNSKKAYPFSHVFIQSKFDENKIRTINIKSADIADGSLVGKFKFGELENLISNSLGSLYANFKPIKVNKGQFLDFNFNLKNKIFDILYPDSQVDSSTLISGKIDSDSNEFNLDFSSSNIRIANTSFDNIKINLDNQNPIYNVYMQLDSIKTPVYKINDFNLINITLNDTLYVRSEFKGGNKAEDKFNINFFHTINKEGKNIVGIKKSDINFKNFSWYLNDQNSSDNQVVFDNSFQNFDFNQIKLSHENQEILFEGTIKDKVNKDLKLNFKVVDLYKITPFSDVFYINGNLDGEINFKQKGTVYQPNGNLTIDDLNINDVDFGAFNIDIEGNQDLKQFAINSSITKNFKDILSLKGNFNVNNNKNNLDLDVVFSDFDLRVFNPLGKDVISNIRGMMSGGFTVGGTLEKTKFQGNLFVDEAGLTIPYLNTDYALKDDSRIILVGNKFVFDNNELIDTKFKTKGILKGSILHDSFTDWELNLGINSDRLLVLDTKDSEESIYYGTAFINGSSTIEGKINEMLIKVAATSAKGSSIKIPINESTDLEDKNLIHFVTLTEKINKKNGVVAAQTNYKGLELEFDLDVTPDAEIEVILDRNSGHGMRGKGFGSLLFKINTLGKFNMWGDFQAYEGSYNFKYGGIIDKKFNVKKGGSIIWEGDPLRAQLNLEAVYKTNANPALLLDNPSFNRKVPVDLTIDIKGDILNPEPDFNIDFPTVSNVLKTEIQYKLIDKDNRQRQAVSLLSTGGFMSAEGLGSLDFAGSFFETASSMLDGILKEDQDKIKVGLNYITANRTLGKETDGRVEALVSTTINERISINGKVGVPFGGINESAIVGDVEAQYRVNEDGTLNLRLFNRENNVNYIGEGIGYTQGMGLSYQVDFNTFKELKDKILEINKTLPPNDLIKLKSQTPNPPQGQPLELIQFSNTKQEEEKKQEEKNNQDATIKEEEL
jgi:hypothetical protein